MGLVNFNSGSTNRRHFIKASALVGAAALGPVHLLGDQNNLTQDKLNIAVVGVGGRGGANLNGCSAHVFFSTFSDVQVSDQNECESSLVLLFS